MDYLSSANTAAQRIRQDMCTLITGLKSRTKSMENGYSEEKRHPMLSLGI